MYLDIKGETRQYMKKNQSLKQHNAITTARYEITTTEKNIVYGIIAQIKENDPPDKVYTFHVSSICDGKEVKYNNIKEATNRLLSRVYEIKKPNGGWLKITMVSSIEYIPECGTIEVKIDSKLRPYLFDLKNNFTTFQLKMALDLRSKYAKRMYEMLSQYKDTGFMKISVADLKERLKLLDKETGEEKYSKWSMFVEKVLEVAKRELSEKTDIAFSYTPLKEGKKFTHLTFEVTYRPSSFEKRDWDDTLNALFERLVNKYGLSSWQAKRILEEILPEEINKTLYELQIKIVNGKINNIGGYTARLFKDKYPFLFSGKDN